MGPFGRKVARERLAGHGTEPVAVAVVTTLVSPANVVSPISGVRAAILVIELVERIREGQASESFVSLGSVVLGDLVTLRDADGDEVTLVAHRARVEPPPQVVAGTPLANAPAEVVPLLRRASGRGVVCYREVPLETGARVRLEAVVDRARTSATRTTYVARDDLAPVVLEAVPEAAAG